MSLERSSAPGFGRWKAVRQFNCRLSNFVKVLGAEGLECDQPAVHHAGHQGREQTVGGNGAVASATPPRFLFIVGLKPAALKKLAGH